MNLIYFPEDKLKSSGGPSGYLYNLKQQLKKIGNSEIVFLPAEKEIVNKDKLKNALPKRLVEFRKALRFTRMYKEKQTPPVDLNLYDTVHFHRTDDLYRCREALENYNGKVILTSHTPCARFQELIDMLNPADAKIFQKKLQTLKLIDEFAFKRADYIVFPCREAEEPYYHTWNEYRKIKNPEKYLYLPTGINPCTAKVARDEIRKTYNIPKDAFVISYVGRHNEIKGYDIVKEIGKKFLNDPKVYFLIAGKEEPIKGLKNPRWIEVGWTNDPHSIIAAADMFILPNRETYFDLIMLEVLSLGQIVVASKTGGNKFFEKFGSEGICLYNDVDDAYTVIMNLMKTEKNYLQNMRDANKKIFSDEFTVEKFTDGYIKIIQLINSQIKKESK